MLVLYQTSFGKAIGGKEWTLNISFEIGVTAKAIPPVRFAQCNPGYDASKFCPIKSMVWSKTPAIRTFGYGLMIVGNGLLPIEKLVFIIGPSGQNYTETLASFLKSDGS